jgi:hypothetical protein
MVRYACYGCRDFEKLFLASYLTGVFMWVTKCHEGQQVYIDIEGYPRIRVMINEIVKGSVKLVFDTPQDCKLSRDIDPKYLDRNSRRVKL